MSKWANPNYGYSHRVKGVDGRVYNKEINHYHRDARPSEIAGSKYKGFKIGARQLYGMECWLGGVKDTFPKGEEWNKEKERMIEFYECETLDSRRIQFIGDKNVFWKHLLEKFPEAEVHGSMYRCFYYFKYRKYPDDGVIYIPKED